MFSLQYKHVLHFSNNQIAWKHNKSGRNQRFRRATLRMGGGGGGAPLVTQYWGGGTKHFFLLILYNFKNIGGGGGAHAPPVPLLSGPWEFGSFEKPSLGQPAF